MQALKNNYKYYLANGACIEYSLSSDSNLVEVIDGLVWRHYNATSSLSCDVVLVRPEIASALNKEAIQRGHYSYVSNFPNSGFGLLRLQTTTGPVTVIVAPTLEIPIFMGSEQELKDNSFNAAMEDILCE